MHSAWLVFRTRAGGQQKHCFQVQLVRAFAGSIALCRMMEGGQSIDVLQQCWAHRGRKAIFRGQKQTTVPGPKKHTPGAEKKWRGPGGGNRHGAPALVKGGVDLHMEGVRQT